jgi:hypothetical protein
MSIGLARLPECAIGNNVLMCIVPQIEYANNAGRRSQRQHSTRTDTGTTTWHNSGSARNLRIVDQQKPEYLYNYTVSRQFTHKQEFYTPYYNWT